MIQPSRITSMLFPLMLRSDMERPSRDMLSLTLDDIGEIQHTVTT